MGNFFNPASGHTVYFRVLPFSFSLIFQNSKIQRHNLSELIEFFKKVHPSYTDQKVSFAKMVAKVLQINSKFCDFFAMATCKNYLAWFYKRGKRGLSYLDVAIATLFCQCNSQKLVAKIFGQCKSAATSIEINTPIANDLIQYNCDSSFETCQS